MACLIHGPTQNCCNGKCRIFPVILVHKLLKCFYASQVCTSFQSLSNMVDVLNFLTLKSLVFLFLFAFKKKIPSAFSSIYLLSLFLTSSPSSLFSSSQEQVQGHDSVPLLMRFVRSMNFKHVNIKKWWGILRVGERQGSSRGMAGKVQ